MAGDGDAGILADIGGSTRYGLIIVHVCLPGTDLNYHTENMCFVHGPINLMLVYYRVNYGGVLTF